MAKTFVGSRVRQLRGERGFSQAALAQMLDISPSYLNQIEHDVRPLTVPVLLRMLELFPEWTKGLVMVQLEVADRLAARPGSKVYGVPSVKLAWYASSARVGTVPPKVFWPVPNVDSGLVSMTRHAPPETTASREQVFTVVDAAFAQRRKMLRGALSGLFGGSAAATDALELAGVDPQARGEVLTIEDFVAIAEQLPR